MARVQQKLIIPAHVTQEARPVQTGAEATRVTQTGEEVTQAAQIRIMDTPVIAKVNGTNTDIMTERDTVREPAPGMNAIVIM